jgi:hypothetical protein
MALELTKNLDNGFSGNYWKVLETNINWKDKYSHITLGLFKDKAARDAGKTIIDAKAYDWSGADFPFVDGKSPRDTSYDKIKVTAEFSGSKDV